MHVKALVVEDCVEFANILKNLLINDYNAQVSWVGSTGVLKSVFRKVRPTLVLLDLMLQSQFAIDYIPKLKRLGSTVIVISAFNDNAIVNKVYTLGADIFVSKPTNLGYLRNILRKYFNTHKTEEAVLRDFRNNYIASYKLPNYVLEWLDMFKSSKLRGYVFTNRDRFVLGVLYQYKRVPKEFLMNELGISEGNLRVLLFRLRRKLLKSKSPYSIWADHYGNLVLINRVSQFT